MNCGHRISLHLSRGNSITESPKDQSGAVPGGFSKAAESVERTQEQLEKLNEFVNRSNEIQLADWQVKDLVYYKQLAKRLDTEKKELEEKNREMKLILKELKPKPGMEKILESSKKLIKDFGKAFRPEIEKELGGSEEFLALIKINNIQEAFVRSLNLSRELMRKRKINLKSGSGSPKSRISELIEDDLSQIIKETSHLIPRVIDQKLEEYTRRLETSVNNSHDPKDSPLFFSVHSRD